MASPLTPDRPLELCAFWVGGAVYAIDVARVDEVLPRVVPLPVPGVPEHVEGVVHLQGATVPIVDLRRLLPPGDPAADGEAQGGGGLARAAAGWDSASTGWPGCSSSTSRTSRRPCPIHRAR